LKKTQKNYILQRYILKEYVFSFLIAFLFFFFIFFINQILLVARNILLKNVSAFDMLRILTYSIPIILLYSFPFASMTGATISLGGLSSRNEIQAMRTSGVSYKQILIPIIIFSLILTGISFTLNDIFLPLGTIRYKSLYRELLYENPGLELESFSVSRFNNLIFVNGKVDENTIEDLIIIDTNGQEPTIISSEHAELSSDDEKMLISLKLRDVQSISPKGSSRKDFDYFTSDAMDYYMQLKEISFNLLGVAPNEKSLRDLYGDIVDKRKEITNKKKALAETIENASYRIASDYYLDAYGYADRDYMKDMETLIEKREVTLFSRTLQYYSIEFYKKTALPFACFFLVFFAFPFSLIPMKNGRLVGFSIGIITSVIYWFLLFAGQTMGTRTTIHPFLIMWAPNIILFTFGIFFLFRRMRT